MEWLLHRSLLDPIAVLIPELPAPSPLAACEPVRRLTLLPQPSAEDPFA